MTPYAYDQNSLPTDQMTLVFTYLITLYPLICGQSVITLKISLLVFTASHKIPDSSILNKVIGSLLDFVCVS